MKLIHPYLLLLVLIIVLKINVAAQKTIFDISWKSVATGMPENWYGTEESILVAENVLLFQRNVGGWPKNTAFHLLLDGNQKDSVVAAKNNPDAIFDNGATTTEIRFLAKMYNKTKTEQYRSAVEKGIGFILDAQYENGGWPMFYPLRKGYYSHITFNDDAIVKLMNLLKEVYTGNSLFSFISDGKLKLDCQSAWNLGLECILKTQIIVNGKPTVWCAQHDENTLKPAKARAYELPSFSGGESVGLLELLMDIDNPSPEIINAVEGGVAWLEEHKLKNTRWDEFTNSEGKKDRRIVTDPKAGNMWARFYDLETSLPYICDRDGIKKSNLEEISFERRNGYSWFTDSPQRILDAYPAWKLKLKK